MNLQTGEYPIIMRRKTRVITKSEYLAVWNPPFDSEKITHWFSFVSTARFGNYGVGVNETYTSLMFWTQTSTPFRDIYSNPTFRLVFDHRTWAPHSWVDVMISAKSYQKSVIIKNGNC